MKIPQRIKERLSPFFGIIGKQITLVVIGDAITYFSGFISIMILARILPVEIMGSYRQIVFLGLFFVSIFEFGLTNSIYRFWTVFSKEEQIEYTQVLFFLLSLLGVLSFIFLYFPSDLYAKLFDNPHLGYFIKITALYPLTNIIFMMLRPILICKGYSLQATGIETFFSICTLAALALPNLLGYSFEFSLFIWMIVLGVKLLIVPIFLKEYIFKKYNFTITKHYLNLIFFYIWPIQIGRLPGIIMSNFDKFFMSILLSPYQFAIYSLGAKEIPFIGTIGYSVANVIIPKLVIDYETGNLKNLFRRWKLAVERSALAVFLPTTFCFVFADQVVSFLFSNTYIESTSIFRVFVCVTYLRLIEYASLAKVMNKTSVIMKASIFSLIVLVVLSYPFTQYFGAIGMCWALLISTVTNVVYYLIWYKKELAVPINDFFPFFSLGFLLVLSFISCLIIKTVFHPWASVDDTSFIILGLRLVFMFGLSACLFMSFLFIKEFVKKWRFTGGKR